MRFLPYVPATILWMCAIGVDKPTTLFCGLVATGYTLLAPTCQRFCNWLFWPRVTGAAPAGDVRVPELDEIAAEYWQQRTTPIGPL